MSSEQAARDFYNAAGGSFQPVASVGVAAPPVAPAEAAPVLSGPEPAGGDRDGEPQQGFYAPVLTRGLVEWNEAPATPERFDLEAPAGFMDRSEEGQAALARLREGFAAAGVGVTVARELFGDAVTAQQDARWAVPREQAETELRQHFGARYDAQIEAARALVQRAAARCPEIVPFLERTGLGNSPEFIRKLAAAAGRRPGRSFQH